MTTILGKYAQNHMKNKTKAKTKTEKVKRTVIQIVRKIMNPPKPIYDVCDESGAWMLRNDLLAKAFLFRDEIENKEVR